jgi:hypothetical protein
LISDNEASERSSNIYIAGDNWTMKLQFSETERDPREQELVGGESE